MNLTLKDLFDLVIKNPLIKDALMAIFAFVATHPQLKDAVLRWLGGLFGDTPGANEELPEDLGPIKGEIKQVREALDAQRAEDCDPDCPEDCDVHEEGT